MLNPGKGSKFMQPSAASWHEARDNCLALGGDLVSIENFLEYQYLFYFQYQSGEKGAMWLGLNDQERSGIWQWSDGTPLSFAFWMDGQPNTYGGMDEDCVGAVMNDIFYWGDTPCQRRYYLIIIPYLYVCSGTFPVVAITRDHFSVPLLKFSMQKY